MNNSGKFNLLCIADMTRPWKNLWDHLQTVWCAIFIQRVWSWFTAWIQPLCWKMLYKTAHSQKKHLHLFHSLQCSALFANFSNAWVAKPSVNSKVQVSKMEGFWIGKAWSTIVELREKRFTNWKAEFKSHYIEHKTQNMTHKHKI